MLRDNRGVTLMELVAAIALTSVLLTVAIMLYQSLFHVSESGMQRYAEQSEIRNALSMLERELADVIDVKKVDNQLHYDDGLGAPRALVFEQNRKTLTVYELNNDGGLDEDNSAVIAENVTGFSADVNDGARTLDLRIDFEVSKVNASGIRQTSTETRELSFRWMSVPS